MARMVRALKRLIGAERGAALVEFTVLMPLLFALMAGFIEFGMALQRHHVVQKSLRDATRYLAQVPGFDATTPVDATPCNATPTGQALIAKNLAIYGNIGGTGTSKISGWGYDGVCVIGPTSRSVTFNGVTTEVLVVQMTAQAPYNDIGFLSILGFTGITLGGSHEQAYLGN